MKNQFYLFILICLFIARCAWATMGRYDHALDPIRTAIDASNEGKVSCVNFIPPLISDIEDNDIKIENGQCYYTKRDYKIITRSFIKNLQQALDLEILTHSTSVRQLVLYQNLSTITLNMTLKQTSKDLLNAQKCKATYSPKLPDESLFEMNKKIDNASYPKLYELMNLIFQQFRCF